MKKANLIFFILCMALGVNAQSPFAGARWIGATKHVDDILADRSIWVSKTVRLKRNIAKATLNICGLGQYEFYVDGRKINDDLLAPAWSDYRKTLFYNTFDITDRLSANKTNTLECLLGNGFYHERGLRYHKLKSSFGPLTMVMRLDVTYKDGTRQTIVSDGSWMWKLSPITYNSIYGGEDYDARMENAGVSNKVVVQDAPQGKLLKQLSMPVRVMRRYGVAQRLPNNVYDMGQNLAGFPEIRVKGKRGQQVKLIVGESLTADGHVSQKQTGKPYFLTYTLKGDGIETWHPRFTYNGYRYVEIEGLQPDSLWSCFISNAAPTIATFECSSERMNKAYAIIDNAIRSNWQNVWTDCPHREKLGWLEQDWLNGPGLMANYDARAMIEQTMQLIADAQHSDGSLPEIAPEYITFEGSWAPPFQESPEWGGAVVALPLLYADYYADSSLYRKYLPVMKRYVDYLDSRDSCGILRMGLGDWYDYGPWRAGFARNTPMPLVATAHFYRWTKALSSEAGYSERAHVIRKAFIKEYGGEGGAVWKSQAALAIALELGLHEEGQRQMLLDSLVADIHRHGNRLTTGDVGTPYLFKVLIDNGQEQLLWTMLDHDDVPGYGAQLIKGMTTLTEQWNPDMGASRNHFMLGHINNHLLQDMVGIRVHGKEVTVCPRFIGDATWARGSTMVAGCKVSVAWRIEGGRFVLDVQPEGEYQQLNITINEKEISAVCARHGLQLQLAEGADQYIQR